MTNNPQFTPEEIAAEEARRRRDNPVSDDTPVKLGFWDYATGPILLIVLIGVGIWLFNSCSNSSDNDPANKPEKSVTKNDEGKTDDKTIKGWDRAESRSACHDKVKAQLKSPSTAKFEGLTETVFLQNADKTKWTIRGHVDSQNSFGAEVRAEWACTVIPKDKDTASVEAVLVQ